MKSRKSIVDMKTEEALAKGLRPSEEIVHDASALSYFLRHYRGRADLAEIVNERAEPSLTQSIEKVRSSLATGNLAAAEEALSKLDLQDETGEVAIEKMRACVFKGEFREALNISDSILKAALITPMTVMTCYQLRGHCWIGLAEFQTAETELKRALILAELYPFAKSAVSSAAFLVIAFLGLRRVPEAHEALQKLRQSVLGLEQHELLVDRLLIVLRTEVHFFAKVQDVEQHFDRLMCSSALAKWLGDGVVLRKCEIELSELKAQVSSMVSSHREFPNWLILPRENLILSHEPKKIFRFEVESLLDRVLRELLKESLSMQDLFERVWQLPYSGERHELHVRATLSNLRKKLPPGCLVVKNQTVHLV